MRSVLLSIQRLLNEPNVEDPLNEEVTIIILIISRTYIFFNNLQNIKKLKIIKLYEEEKY